MIDQLGFGVFDGWMQDLDPVQPDRLDGLGQIRGGAGLATSLTGRNGSDEWVVSTDPDKTEDVLENAQRAGAPAAACG